MRKVFVPIEDKMKKGVTYYQSPMGAPYAIKGNRIAGYAGQVRQKRVFYVMTIKEFEKTKFGIFRLREVTEMAQEFRRGLEEMLK